MEIEVLKAKIHRATVTDADLHYEGSITLGAELLEAARLHPYERVDIYNISNGERFSTYVITGKKGEVCLNGAAAWKVRVGDRVIIASYARLPQDRIFEHRPRVVLMGDGNEIKSISDATIH